MAQDIRQGIHGSAGAASRPADRPHPACRARPARQRRFHGRCWRFRSAARGDAYFWADAPFASTAGSAAALGRLTGRRHLAFPARDRAMVDAVRKAGLQAGGTDNGGPGERACHPGYYPAFLLGPGGNTTEAVFHGEARRSAPSVKVTF